MTTSNIQRSSDDDKKPIDEIHRVVNFFEGTPKKCMATLRYVTDWAIIFFKTLKDNPLVMRAASAFKHGLHIFRWPAFFINVNKLRMTTMNYCSGKTDGENKKTTFKKVLLSLGDAVSKTSELGQWLMDTKILSLSAAVGSTMLSFGGISMVIGLSNRIYTTLKERKAGHNDERAEKLWKAAKYTSLLVLGVFLTLTALTGLYNPIIPLICNTGALVASYGEYVLQNPLKQTECKQREFTKVS